jgi:hypothetical protein
VGGKCESKYFIVYFELDKEIFMKRLMMASTVFFCMLFIAPVWAHHPAEGIVSDEVWQMVDDLLTAAESPHLDIDFDNVMDSMSFVTDSEGRSSAETTITVVITADDTDGVTYDDYLYEMGIVIAAIEEAISETSGVPSTSGTTNKRPAPTLWEIELIQFDDDRLGEETFVTWITLSEPVGSGESQDGVDPMNPDAKKRR